MKEALPPKSIGATYIPVDSFLLNGYTYGCMVRVTFVGMRGRIQNYAFIPTKNLFVVWIKARAESLMRFCKTFILLLR